MTAFPPLDISVKLALAIRIGLLVGLEREWSQMDLGARTFAITALVGTLSIFASPLIASVSFAGILVILLLIGIRNMRDAKPREPRSMPCKDAIGVLSYRYSLS